MRHRYGGVGIEVQSLEFGVYPGNKNLYGVYFSNLPFLISLTPCYSRSFHISSLNLDVLNRCSKKLKSTVPSTFFEGSLLVVSRTSPLIPVSLPVPPPSAFAAAAASTDLAEGFSPSVRIKLSELKELWLMN